MTNDYGYVRVAIASPKLVVANPLKNALEHAAVAKELAQYGVQVLLFPELSLTGYTCKDLFLNQDLLRSAEDALEKYLSETRTLEMVSVVGMPLAVDGSLYNVAVCCQEGKILAIIPKSHIPTYKEFEELRWFSPASQLRRDTVRLLDQTVPIGTDILLEAENIPHLVIGVEICEDLWLPIPPSSHAALQGATLLLNLSASNDVVTKDEYRRSLVASQSARCIGAYAYASCGPDESSSDVVFGGHCLVAENGTIINEWDRISKEPGSGSCSWTEVDLERLVLERQRTGSFGQNAVGEERVYRRVTFSSVSVDVQKWGLQRVVDPRPFVPSNPATRDERCERIEEITTAGLVRRLEHLYNVTGNQNSVIGISGGLDSTLALLTTCRAYDRLGWSRSKITAVTMPGFGTTDRTYRNAVALCKALGVTFREIPIRDATMQHLRDIGHKTDADTTVCRGSCLTCQNAQARIRTLILMDLGFVNGTGDLSEIALGFCTYNGDHMSMYNVNCGIPKTLIKFLVRWIAENGGLGDEVRRILLDVIDTPVSPELELPGEDGKIAQKTEDIIGPYNLNDFFLFHILRNGFGMRKVAFLATEAFRSPADQEVESYDRATIVKWLRMFARRFIANQFKRNAAPDGPKVGSVSLSQRGDWRMPSDITAALWFGELDVMDEEIRSSPSHD